MRNSVKLADKSFEELKVLRESIENNPINQMPKGESWYLYTPLARKKLDDIAWAVTYKLQRQGLSK